MSTTVNQDRPLRVDSIWRRLGWALWPPRCLICAEPGLPGRDLCRTCEADWPRIGTACLRCALPLPGVAAAGVRFATIDPPGPPGLPDLPLVCGHCLRRPPPLTQVHAACLYRPPLDRLLPRFKFHRDLAAGRLLTTMMANAFEPLLTQSPSTTAPGLAAPSASDIATEAPAPVLVPIPLHRRRLRERGYDQALELARPLSRQLRLPLLDHGLIRLRDTPAQSLLDAKQRRRNLRGAFAWRHGQPLPAHIVLIDDVMTTGATLHSAAAALRRAGAQRVDAWVCARVTTG
ncbi:ComF family protein [Lysobacter antibioticus]|uniref:ComF family protein n=1 Tax=Lysobacter antibioticus TaxID=84531 RepID=UPI0007166BC3|nr:ComF family protein [Lysobacter antibioticus]